MSQRGELRGPVCPRSARGACRDGHAGEVIVVDNDSTDNSAEVARSAGAVVVSETRPGYGRAIRTGVDAARGDIVVMADADLTYDLSLLSELVRPVLTGQADLVIGSRRGASRRNDAGQSSSPGDTATHLSHRSRSGGDARVRDSQSGFRAFRRDCFLDLHLRSTGMELASEMLIQATRSDLRLVEVRTGYRQRVGSSKLAAYTDGRRHLRQIAFLALTSSSWDPARCCSRWASRSPRGHRWPTTKSNSDLCAGSRCSSPRSRSCSDRRRCCAGWCWPHAPCHVAAHPPPTRVRAEPTVCQALPTRGTVVGVAGLAIDVALVPLRATPAVPYGRALALAGVGQAFLIVGCTFVGFGLLYDVLRDDERQ